MNVYYQGNAVTLGDGYRSLAGKKVLLIGDSNIAYFDQTLLVDTITSLTGCDSVGANATAGAKWAAANGNTDTSITTMVGKVNTIVSHYEDTGIADDYDVIAIMMGTNDADSNIGDTVISTSATPDGTTMCGSMHYCLRKLLYYYREGTIVGIIPPQSEYSPTRYERYTAMKQVYDYYSIPVLDFWGAGQVVANQKTENKRSSYLGDGIHFSTNGRFQFMHKVSRFLETQV